MRLFLCVKKMSPSQRDAWLWPFLCGARALWMHRGPWQAKVSVHGRRLVMKTGWETTANPEAEKTRVWLVLRGIHCRAQGQRPNFPMNGSVTTELEMQNAWRNEWIQMNLHLHKSASCMSEHRWWVKDWVGPKLEQSRSKRTTREQFQVKHFPVG